MTGEAGRTQIVPFRGDYYTFKPEAASRVRGLIYPVPDPRVPFLGVHFTRIVNGEVWAGPNAVWAFAREGYRRTDFNLRDVWEAVSGPAFLRFALRYWQIGLDEFWRDTVKAAYVREIQKYLPEVQGSDLIDGPSGVRAMAISPDGKIYDDFLMIHSERVTHVLNAPSPAATASLVLGRMIADEVIEHQGLPGG
jgi:L-2-hydroxyglutarate oxidase LhgO